LALVLGAGLALAAGCHRKSKPIVRLTNTAWASQELWKEAAEQVEEQRNEPMGSRAKVQVPEELKQYSNRHEFLGTQVAEFRKDGYGIPEDYGDLAVMISKGNFVEMSPVGKDYVLFGIGGMADRGRITRYDRATGSSIPLYADQQEIDKGSLELTAKIADATGLISELAGQLRGTERRDRRRARSLRAKISNKQSLVASLEQTKALMDSWYGDPVRRDELLAEYHRVAAVAADFGGSSYDLQDPDARLEFKLRLLSYIRPSARTVLEEIASDYSRRFKRPLPVTSMIRTMEYQAELGEVNPNAARNSVPPHTTGLAFDVYYHYMTAAEQDFLMEEIAWMKDAGRVEALRETRDHFHIFAFADGQRPSGQLIAESSSEMGDASASAGAGRSRIASAIRWRSRTSMVRLASHRRARS
jgi:hypothetical protein